VQGSTRVRGYGATHDATTLEGEGDVDGLSIQAIDLSNGIAGGGVEAEGEHRQNSSMTDLEDAA